MLSLGSSLTPSLQSSCRGSAAQLVMLMKGVDSLAERLDLSPVMSGGFGRMRERPFGVRPGYLSSISKTETQNHQSIADKLPEKRAKQHEDAYHHRRKAHFSDTKCRNVR